MIKEISFTEDIGKRIAEKRDMMGFPRTCLFEITHRCNLRCRHCYISHGKYGKEMSTEDVKSLFDRLVEAGCAQATITGGEPMLREDILPLIGHARRIGLFIHLFTNATLVTPQIADKLKEFQLVSLEISLHSLRKDRFDRFTRVEGSYDRVMEAIRLFRERGLEIALKISLTKNNIDEVRDLKKFAEDIQAYPEWSYMIRPMSDGSKENTSLRLTPDEICEANKVLGQDQVKEEDNLTRNSLKDRAEPEKDLTRPKFFRCQVGKDGLAITPYGEMKPCLEFTPTKYHVFDRSLKESWKMLGDLVESFSPGPEYKCLDCDLGPFCSSCPAKARLECGNMNACPDYYRRTAEFNRSESKR